jgi:transaldolase
LARDADATIAAATSLSSQVDRPNVMIKIPATIEGLDAVRQVLGAGISVNVTLIFSLERYAQVIDAWLDGLELAQRHGHDLARIASVASFFVSRVDAAVDALLDDGDPRRGTTANAQVAGAYQHYLEQIASSRATALIGDGAQVQRPLWASTSPKNPTYDELLYVNRIVADETVNTMPDATLAAVLEHADFAQTTLSSASEPRTSAALLDNLPENVSLADVTDRLERDGVQAFVDSYEELLATVATKLQGASMT